MARSEIAAVLLLASGAARAGEVDDTCETSVVWPGEHSGWQDSTSFVMSYKEDELVALEEYAFTLEGSDWERKGVRTDGLIVIQGGTILYENYGRGFGQGNSHLIWSVTKSLQAAIVGRAVKEGLLTLDDSICDYLPNIQPSHCAITVKELLRFGSGLDWNETYEGQTNQHSSVLAMLYGVGAADQAQFVVEHELRDEPGTTFAYSSGDAVLLAGVLKAAVEPTRGTDYPWDLLADELGITSLVYERDPSGTYVGSSWAYMTPRDMARLGLLYLRDGCWEGQRILPEGWVASSVAVEGPITHEALCCGPDDVAGWSWWMNQPVSETGLSKAYPDVPSDMFYASGHWGQYIWVVPSWDLIVVRTGDDRDGTFDGNHLLQLAMDVATEPNR